MVEAHAYSAFEILDLFFVLNLDQLGVAIKSPTGAAYVGLYAFHAAAFEFGPFLVRENDYVNKRLKRNDGAFADNAKFSASDWFLLLDTCRRRGFGLLFVGLPQLSPSNRVLHRLPVTKLKYKTQKLKP